MAWNNYAFPVGYQPQIPQVYQTPQTQQNGINWVQGIAGAKAFIAIPEGGTVGPIALALAVNGEARPTSRSIVTPAAAEQYFSVSSGAIIDVPAGCCTSISLRAVPASDDPTVTPAPVINVQNLNIRITRIA